MIYDKDHTHIREEQIYDNIINQNINNVRPLSV